MKASQIVRGDKVADQYGQSFTVARVDHNMAEGQGVYLWPEGASFPQFYLNDSPLTLTDFQATAGATQPAPAPLSGLMAGYVQQAEADLRKIARYGDDGQWRYMKWVTTAGRTYSREYRTQKGFLESYIREARRGSDILIAE